MNKNLFKNSIEKHFDGRQFNCFQRRHKSPLDIFTQIVEAAPNREVIIDGDNRITYQALDGLSSRFGSSLLAKGLKTGDRVAINTKNRVEFIVAMFGCLKAGLISVPIGHEFKRTELIELYNEIGASAVLFDKDTAKEQPSSDDVKSIKIFISAECKVDFATEFYPFILAPATDLTKIEYNEEDCASILYTSGVDSKPKAVIITHMNIVHSVMHFVKDIKIKDAETTIISTPLTHVTGLITQMYLMIACGGKMVLMKEFKEAEYVRLAQREKLTYSVMANFMYRQLLKKGVLKGKTFKDWHIALYGDALMSKDAQKSLGEALPNLEIYNGYGATEATSIITILPHVSKDSGNNVGKVVACGEIKIVDDKGCEVKKGKPGELWIKGPMVTPGYWNNNKDNKDFFEDGYWKSGDIGYCNEDGYHYVLDRKSHLIKRGDHQIFSVKIESLLKEIDGIMEAALVPYSCKEMGQRTNVIVYKGQNKITKKQITEYLSNELEDYQMPDKITFSRKRLPRNGNGKILKSELTK